MLFPTPLVPGRLIRRYKRFLADVELEDGSVVVAHCPNTGAMTGFKEPGIRVWLEPNDDPKRKLNFGWRLVELPDGHWAGIDTAVPNRVVKEALNAKLIPELSEYSAVRPEVNYGEKSRVDFLLTEPGLPDAYVEVKNVHLSRERPWAEFPDSPTARGARHMDELAQMVKLGHRAFLFYVVQRTDCIQFRLADDVDPTYANAFSAACEAGVEVLCYDTEISVAGVTIGKPLKISL